MIEFTPPKRTEPSYNGIPRRIWRGRTVELLRNADAVSPENMSKDLFGELATDQDRKWLHEVLLALEKDGIIVQEEGILRLRED